MSPRKLFTILISLSIILFVFFTVYFFKQAMKPPRLPALGQVKYFTLIDSQGKNFSLDDLRGRVWIASFFFTTCSDICPVMSKNMASLHRTFDKVNGVRLVSISVNPEQDSSEALAKYAQKYNANTQKWIFLTGGRDDITQLTVKSFKLGAIDKPIFHSPNFTLVDRHGFIRGYYDGTRQEDINRLFKDTSKLIIER